MKCPVCAVAELVHDTRDVTYIYKGETALLPLVEGDFCPACDESALDAAESRRTMDLMQAFNKQVNAFSRYENGKTKPPLALVTLLNLLDRHPDSQVQCNEKIRGEAETAALERKPGVTPECK